MRVESLDFAYILSCGVFLNFMVVFRSRIEAATTGVENQSYFNEDFSDVTILQSDNQKIIVYRDAIKRECYLEPTLETNLDHQPHFRKLFIEDQKKTSKNGILEKLSQDVLTYCKNYTMIILEKRGSNVKSRIQKRQLVPQSKKEHFKGQTQTQFISFDNDGKNDKGGTAEAIAEQDKSRATVQGRLGMGQAQSQSGSGDPCEELGGSFGSVGLFSSPSYPSTVYPTGQGSHILPSVAGSPQQGANVAGQIGGAPHPPGQGSNIPPNSAGSQQQGANMVPGQFGGSLHPPSQSSTGTGISYPPGPGTNIPPNSAGSPQQGANVAGQIGGASYPPGQGSNIPPNSAGYQQQGANIVPGQFGGSLHPPSQSSTGTGISYPPGPGTNIPPNSAGSPQQGANVAGQIGGASYPPGQGTNIPPNSAGSQQQGANIVPDQFGGSLHPPSQSPTGTSIIYPPGPGLNILPGTFYPPGQESNTSPNMAGSPQQGVYVPGQFDSSSHPSLQLPAGAGTLYLPHQGSNLPPSVSGFPQQGTNEPDQLSSLSYPSITFGGGQNQLHYPSTGQPGTSGIPQISTPIGGAGSSQSQHGLTLYPSHDGQPSASAGSLVNQGVGSIYTQPSGFPLTQTGTSKLQPGYGQGGLIRGSEHPMYTSQGSSSSLPKIGGQASYLQQSGYNPETSVAKPGIGIGGSTNIPQQGYTPSSGTDLGIFQGEGTSYPSGYFPQLSTHSSGYSPGSKAPHGNVLFAPSQGYVPQSNTRHLQQSASGFPYGRSNQFQTGVGGYSQQPSYFSQSAGFPSTLPHASVQVNGPQSGTNSVGYPQNHLQSSGQSFQRGTDPQQGQSGAALFPGGVIYPQSSVTSVSPDGRYSIPQGTYVPTGENLQPGATVVGTYPQIGGGSIPGVGSYQQVGVASIPGGGGYPQAGATSIPVDGGYPQGGATSIISGGSYSQGGSTIIPGGGYLQGVTSTPWSSFSPQGTQTGQINTNYPQGSTGYSPQSNSAFSPQGTQTGQINANYPQVSTGYSPQTNTGYYQYIPGTGNRGQQLSSGSPSLSTNTGFIQRGSQNFNSSLISQTNSIDTASGESQSLSSLNLNSNGTNAAASAQGKTLNGMAQAQVSGTYTGSFSAQAQTSDNEKSVQTQIFGNTTSATSSSQGKAGKSESQSQIQYNYNTGVTLAESQGSGINYNTNSQIQVGNKGGIADSQSTGTGSSSSQAQIGFLPPDPKRKDQTALFEGGGTSSSQNSASFGQSQTQLQGSFKAGTSFIGSVQSSAGKAQNRTKLAFDSSALSYPVDNTSILIISTTEQGAKQIVKKENNIVKSTVPLSSVPQNDQRDLTKNTANDNEPPQYQDAEIKSQKYDAYIDRDSFEIRKPIYNAGELVFGTGNYRVPTGLKGKVASTAGDMTHATASALGHAQTQTVALKPGNGRVTVNNLNQSERQKFQNDSNLIKERRNAFDEYVAVTKSEMGELNGDKKFTHTYFTKSSTCGYFTFTCNYIDGSNGSTKICKPGPLTYPDGTPCR